MQILSVLAERPGKLSDALSAGFTPVLRTLEGAEVAVQMSASTVNSSDAVTVSGAYRSRTEFPFVPGFEGIGVIEQAGSGVPEQLLGRRVLPIGSAGNWQQLKRTDYTWCVPVPDHLSDAMACFAYINPLTAHLMVERLRPGTVGSVAVTAATFTIATHLAELFNLQRSPPGRCDSRHPREQA